MTGPAFNIHDLTGKRIDPDSLKGTSGSVSFGSGGGNGGGGHVEVPIKDYVDAKIGEVKARNDARFTEVSAKLDGINSKLLELPSLWKIIGVVATAIGVALGVIFAGLSFAGDRFDGGMSVGSINDELARQNTEAIRSLLDASADQDRRIDALLRAVETQDENPG